MNSVSAIISSKGQITLPANLRRDIGVDFGSRVKISRSNNQIIIEQDDYEDKLSQLRLDLVKVTSLNGTLNNDWNKIKKNVNAAKEAYFSQKYGV